MRNDDYVTLIKRGLLRGYRCQIDGTDFIESDLISLRECYLQCRTHVLRLIREQDGENIQNRPLRERQDWFLMG